MKRLFQLLLFVSTSLVASANLFDLAQPQQYKWFGDSNWALSGSYNKQSAGSIGTPYALVPDASTSGTIKYQFTAGVGGGYRADQIVWWAKRKTPRYYAYLVYQTTSMGVHFDQAMFDLREDALAALEKWNRAIIFDATLDGGMILYESNVQTIAYDQIAVTGSPSGVPSPSEVKNDNARRGWLNDGVVTYDPSLYGGQELRASFWTFQRTAGNEQKLDMQDRGPWVLPPGSRLPSLTLVSLETPPPVATITPSSYTINLGEAITFELEALNPGSSGNLFTGEGAPTNAPMVGTVKVTPTSQGVKKYTYTVSGRAWLTWRVDDPSAKLTLNTPQGTLDVSDPPRNRYVDSPGDYTLTATNLSGSATSPSVHISSIPTASAFANITVNSAGVPALTLSASVSPLFSEYSPVDGPHAGRTYHRSWQEGSSWNAYLGRDGVRVQVTGTSTSEGISQLQLQAKSPAGDWVDLAPSGTPDSSVPNGAGVSATKSFSVLLGAVKRDKPLIPEDPSLVGEWRLRGRAQTTNGNWSDWSATQPLNVIMPIVSQSFTAQTLPPSDASGKWFTASAIKKYTVQELIP